MNFIFFLKISSMETLCGRLISVEVVKKRVPCIGTPLSKK